MTSLLLKSKTLKSVFDLRNKLRSYYIKQNNNFFENSFNKILDRKIKSDFELNNYVYFKNENGIDDWGKDFNDFFKLKKSQIDNVQVTKEEEFEIETFRRYCGYEGEKLNKSLRSFQKNSTYGVYEDRIKSLSLSISKFNLKDNVVVIRRIPIRYFNTKLKKGDIYEEKGFLSTSINLSYRFDYESIYERINNEVLLLLKVPKETEACYTEQLSDRGEYELLIQRNQKIKIEKNVKILSNRIVVGEIVSSFGC